MRKSELASRISEMLPVDGLGPDAWKRMRKDDLEALWAALQQPINLARAMLRQRVQGQILPFGGAVLRGIFSGEAG